jgi:hypothetical protein
MTNENIQDNNQVEQSTEITNVEEITATENQIENVKPVENIENTSDNSETVAVEDNKPKFEAPVNTEALQKQKDEFANLEKQVDDLANNINEESDFRALRKNIVTLKEQIISLFLIPIADKDRLTNTLQETYEKLAEKQAELRQEINKVFDENLEKMNSFVDDKLKEANELDIFKNARKILQTVQKELKSAKLRQSDKDNFFKKVQDVFDAINQKEIAERESYEMECSNNYLILKPKVEQITKIVDESDKFNDARKRLIELQNEIKNTKLKRNNRDELFQVIRECFNRLNERQDHTREAFNSESTENYDKMKPLVEQAIDFASNPSNFATARQTLINLQKELKEIVLSRGQRDEFFGKIREVFTSLNEQQDENREEFDNESNQNYAKLEIKVNEAIMNIEYSNDFRDIREGLLMVQDEIKIMKLKRSQRNELYSKIRLGFEKFDKKRDEYSKQKNVEKKRKLSSILENLNLNVSRMTESLQADKQIEQDLKAKLDSASDDEKVNLEASITDIQSKIEDKSQSLEKTNIRIEDIKQEIEKL